MKQKLIMVFNMIKKYFVDIIFLFVILYYLLNCSLYFYSDVSLKYLLFIIPLFLILYGLNWILKKLLSCNELYVKLFIFIGSCVIYLIWVKVCKTLPRSDYAILIDGAKDLLSGTFKTLSFDKRNYFYFYNFQIGFVIYLATVMKILGTSLGVLKLVEIIVMSLSNLLVYLIVSKMHSKNVGILSSLIYGTLLFNIVGSSIINNQHIALLFVLLSIYLFIKSDKFLFKFFSCLCLFVSYVLRPTGIIIIIALICYCIWGLMNNNDGKLKNKIVTILVIMIVPFLCIRLFDYTMIEIVKIAPNSVISSNAKYFKFVLGIQNTGITGSKTVDARKTQVYFDLKKYGFDYDKYNEASKDYVINRYDDHTRNTINYLSQKMKAFTGGPDNQIVFAVTEDIDDNTVDIIKFCGYIQYILILLFSFIFGFSSLRERKYTNCNSNLDILFKIIFIGYFMIYIFIETQTRYRFEQYLVLSILSGFVLNKMFKLFDKKIFKN